MNSFSSIFFKAAVVLLLAASSSAAGNVRTANFVVCGVVSDQRGEAVRPTDEQLDAVARAAERLRRELALKWLGEELPGWDSPCLLYVKVGRLLESRGGASFSFYRGRAYGWEMNVAGPLERILEDVLPHEVMHTVLATHLGRALPRWFDEGIATSVESESSRANIERRCVQSAGSGYWMILPDLLTRTEYPPGERRLLQMYYQAGSFCAFLLEFGEELAPEGACKESYSRRQLLRLERIAARKGGSEEAWTTAFRRVYGFESLEAAENAWREAVGIEGVVIAI